ncbi:precorrin-3B C(17)-methyltransferase [Chloroflexus sp.]|uniref:precorrin-3B C(17)-methyltransferase n=1 Tax=Chloroflexus sp. TaxID=1904827 RepID=UPI0040494214
MTTIAIFALTRNGVELAARLAATLPAIIWLPERFAALAPGGRCYTNLNAAVQIAWQQSRTIILIAATGIAVRLIAPLLQVKTDDPAVICLDEQGHVVVPLIGGHRAGANALARQIAALTGGQAAITTASDGQGLPALDLIGQAQGWRIATDSATTHVMACLVNGDPIGVWVDPDLPAVRALLGAELAPAAAIEWVADPEELTNPRFAAAIVVSHRHLDPLWPKLRDKGLRYLPPVLVIGIGCRRNVPVHELAAAVSTTLANADLAPECVAAIATADLKADEAGIGELAQQLGVPLTIVTTAQLQTLDPTAFSSSAAGRFDIPGVAEPCATLVAQGPLLVPKQRFARCTVAVALQQATFGSDPTPTGQLTLVSIGPGDLAHLTEAARLALIKAEVITGYARYIDLIRPLLRPDQEVIATPAMGDEMGRARHAIELARSGRRVALISSGDIGIYAMAAPVFENLQASGWNGRHPKVEVIPGVSAFQALAARIGAPINHDLCLISLSDLLTPWNLIERRLRAAAQADFVVALYNPRSQGRNWQLATALSVLRDHRPATTPVVFGRQVSHEDEQITITTLADADPQQADMLTLVLIGNSQSFYLADHIVTPRGYTTQPARPSDFLMSNKATDYPIVITKPAHMPAVVIGGGAVGERKVRGLLAAGIPVRLISPTATDQLMAWAQEGRLIWERRTYRSGDLNGARLVFAATNDRAVNTLIAASAIATGALCNVADTPDEGDFHVPAIYRSGGITIAVSSTGAAPTRAVALRDAIADWLDSIGVHNHER